LGITKRRIYNRFSREYSEGKRRDMDLFLVPKNKIKDCPDDLKAISKK
jgi:hypothetical protein